MNLIFEKKIIKKSLKSLNHQKLKISKIPNVVLSGSFEKKFQSRFDKNVFLRFVGEVASVSKFSLPWGSHVNENGKKIMKNLKVKLSKIPVSKSLFNVGTEQITLTWMLFTHNDITMA